MMEKLEGGGRSLLGVLQERPPELGNWQDADKTTREDRMRNGIIIVRRIPLADYGQEYEFSESSNAAAGESEVFLLNGFHYRKWAMNICPHAFA